MINVQRNVKQNDTYNNNYYWNQYTCNTLIIMAYYIL